MIAGPGAVDGFDVRVWKGAPNELGDGLRGYHVFSNERRFLRVAGAVPQGPPALRRIVT